MVRLLPRPSTRPYAPAGQTSASKRARVAALLVALLLLAPPALGGSTCDDLLGSPGDLDGDGFLGNSSGGSDCDDSASGLWSVPGAVRDLAEITGAPGGAAHTFEWTDIKTHDPGATSGVVYDAIRSENAADYRDPTALCLDPSGTDLSFSDASVPPPGEAYFYLVRARNECGEGSLGEGLKGGLPLLRTGLTCDCSVLCDDGDVCTQDTCSNGSCNSTVVDPSIHRPPIDVAACDGGDVVLDVEASGNGALTYEWFKNGAPVGMNLPSLMLPQVTPADDGALVTVRVIDSCGNSTSSPAVLTVFADPASCSGGLDGQGPPNSAQGAPVHDFQKNSGSISGGGGGGRFKKELAEAKQARAVSGQPMSGSTHMRWDPLMLDLSLAAGNGGSTGPLKWMAPEARARHRYTGGVLGHSGEFIYRAMDVSIPGRGFDFTFGRTYRSREVRSGRMGFQWVDNQDRRVAWENPASPLNLLIHDGSSARIDLYSPDAVGCYTSPGFFRHLCPDPSPTGGFILTFADKRRWFFRPLDGTPTEGRIHRVEDRNGNSQLYTYDPGNGRLLSITDTLSRNISFSYDPNGRITAVTDFSGRVWSYAYSPAGDLVSMTTPAVVGTPTGNDFPSGKTTSYAYSEGMPLAELNHNLQTVTDASGETFLRVITAQPVSPSDPRFDRVDRLWYFGGQTPASPPDVTSYAYVAQTPTSGNNFAVSKTIIGDRKGNVSEIFFDPEGRPVLSRRFTGRAPDPNLPVGEISNRPQNPVRGTDPLFYDVRADYNADSLVTRVIRPGGNEVQVTYDSLHPDVRLRGNRLLLRLLPGPLGGAQSQIDHQWTHATDFGTEVCNGLDNECGSLRGELVSARNENVSLRALLGSENRGLDGRIDRCTCDPWTFEKLYVRGTSDLGGLGGVVGGLGEKLGGMQADFGSFTSGLPTSLDGDPLKEESHFVECSGLAGGGGAVKGHVNKHTDTIKLDTYSSGGGGGDDDLFIVEAWRLGGGYDFGGVHLDVEPWNPGIRGGHLTGVRTRKKTFGQRAALYPTSGPLTSTYYSSRSYPGTYTDPGGNVFTMTYDPSGNLQRVEAPPVTQRAGLPAQTVDWEWASDIQGLVTQSTSPSGRVDTFSYHTVGPQTGYPENVTIDAGGLALTHTLGFDAVGNLVSITDPKGATLTVVRNALNQPVRLVSRAPLSYEIDLYYDASDRIVRIDVRDDIGLSSQPQPYVSTLYSYDRLHRLQRARKERDEAVQACVITEYDYDANDNLAQVRLGEAVAGNQPGNTVSYLYDERDLLFRRIDGQGTPEQITDQLDYDANANVLRAAQGLEDPSGPNETTRVHDGYDRLVAVNDAEGNVTQRTHDGRSNVLSVRLDGELEQGVSGSNIRLAESSCDYDELSRRIECRTDHFITDTGAPVGDGARTDTFVWAPDSRPGLYLDDTGDTTTFLHDTARRLSRITDPLGNQIDLTYDPNSNITKITHLDLPTGTGGSSQSIDTHFEYDALDRMNATEDHAGNRVTFDFDDRSNIILFTDAMDNRIRCSYDGLSRPLSCERDLTDTGTGAGTVVATMTRSVSYDDSHRVVSETDPNGHVTLHGYDPLNRPVSRSDPDGTLHTFAWNVHRDIATRNDASGTQVTYSHDRLNRVTGVSVLPGSGVQGTTFEVWRYDGMGRIVGEQDDDTSNERTFDSHSNVLSETTQVDLLPPLVTTAVHDNEGNLTRINYPSGRQVDYTYDALNRVASIIDPGRGPIVTFDYLGASRERTKLFTNGVLGETDWDLQRRVISTRYSTSGPAGTTLAHHTYLYSDMYRKTERQDQLPGGEFERFSYDSAYRMVESERGVPAGASSIISYTLDVAGNRTQVTGGPDPGPYVLDAAIPPGDAQVHQYSDTPLGIRLYDENGNLTARTEPTGTRALFFDYRNRLVRSERPGTPIQEYVYDARGRRLARREGQVPPLALATQWAYYHCTSSDCSPIQQEEGGVDEYLHRSPGVQPVLEVRDPFGLSSYLHTDDIGSTVLITDALGSAVERADYGDYGALSLLDGSGTPLAAPATSNPYYFRGGRLMEEEGIYDFNGGRYMDVGTGRYLTGISPPSMVRISGVPRDYRNSDPWSADGNKVDGNVLFRDGLRISGPTSNGLCTPLGLVIPWLDLDHLLLDIRFEDPTEEEEDLFTNRGDEEEWE